MLIKQYYLGCLAHASYLIGDEESHVASVVDPQRDTDQYLADAARYGFQIKHVFLTHFHADFVAGHLELRDRLGARIYLGASAKAEYPFTPMSDGDMLEFGRTLLAVLETPGHSPESICILVYDLRKDRLKPYAVLTGDTLFIGDVGRPDLRASLGWSAADLGGMLYDSLHHKLLTLPDETLVYPAHGAGSLCGKNLSTDTISTIGTQRRYNYALQPMGKEEFLALLLSDQPEAPAYFAYDALLNTKERPTLEKTLEQVLKPLSLEELLRSQNTGAQVLDVRDPADFEGGHLVGALNIGLGGAYATWAGTLLDRSRPVVIIADLGREEEAALRLGRIGFDCVAGYLRGGMEEVQAFPEFLQRTDRITAVALAERLGAEEAPLVLDVRTEREWNQGRIQNSLNVPLSRLAERIQEIPRNRKIVVHCAGGYRSSIAVSILSQHGFDDLSDLVGGFSAWEASKLSIATPADVLVGATAPQELSGLLPSQNEW